MTTEEMKQRFAEATALFVQKTGARIEDACAFAGIIAQITIRYITEEEKQ